MDDNQKNNYGGLPPAPEPEIKLRTMESDIKSVEESGGGAPEPQAIRPSDLSGGGAIFNPETTVPEADSAVLGEVKSEVGMGRWLIWLLIIVVLVAVALGGYYYVWPLVYPQPFIPTDSDLIQQPTVTEQAEQPLIPVHRSAFGFSPGEIAQTEAGDYSVLTITAALQSEAEKLTADNALKEVAVQINGEPAEFSRYLMTLLPELAGADLAATLETAFEKDFTAYLYSSDGTVWPGYVAVVKPEAMEILTLLSQLAEIENSSVSNVYLSPPGGNPAAFRTGPVGSKYTSRYASFEQKPASFNYGLFGNHLVISTTYKGMIRALELLGL